MGGKTWTMDLTSWAQLLNDKCLIESHTSNCSQFQNQERPSTFNLQSKIRIRRRLEQKNGFMKKSFGVSHSAHSAHSAHWKGKGSESNPYPYPNKSFGERVFWWESHLVKKSFGVSHFSTFSTLKKGSESNPYPKIISVQKQFKVGTKNVFMKKSFGVSHSAHWKGKGSESNPYPNKVQVHHQPSTFNWPLDQIKSKQIKIKSEGTKRRILVK